jgi:hypothetical protein
VRYLKLLEQVSEELKIPIEVAKEVYLSYWKFIKSKIAELPLDEELSEDQFKELRTNFNVPSIGKLTCTYDRFLRVRKKQQYKKEKNNGRI